MKYRQDAGGKKKREKHFLFPSQEMGAKAPEQYFVYSWGTPCKAYANLVIIIHSTKNF
jgi:hypothetical protein